MQNGQLLSGPAVRDLISKGQKPDDWDKVFILPQQACGELTLAKGEYILRQVIRLS